LSFIWVFLELYLSLAPVKLPIGLGENGRRGVYMPGHLKRTRVVDLTRGKKKTAIKVFYGEISKLAWDPQIYTWPKQRAARDYQAGAQRGVGQGQGQPPAKPVPIMNYTAKMGKELLKQRHTIPNPVVRKWRGVFSNTFRLRWNTVWAINKESGLF
jgi:hypothetical protein